MLGYRRAVTPARDDDVSRRFRSLLCLFRRARLVGRPGRPPTPPGVCASTPSRQSGEGASPVGCTLAAPPPPPFHHRNRRGTCICGPMGAGGPAARRWTWAGGGWPGSRSRAWSVKASRPCHVGSWHRTTGVPQTGSGAGLIGTRVRLACVQLVTRLFFPFQHVVPDPRHVACQSCPIWTSLLAAIDRPGGE